MVQQGGVGAWSREVLAEDAIAPAAQSYRMMMFGGSPILDGAAPPPLPKKNMPPPSRKGKKDGGCS
ncbi:MAG: hypothetical protein GY747_12285 [Planctomycetes bacterium]|nr:hypothetical protein [Planctomycetota bacterium]MCP4771771.1 hypothetical protein [Planctomycetota bacterium]